MKKIIAILLVALISFASGNSYSQCIVKNNGGSPSASVNLTAALALVGTGVYINAVTIEIGASHVMTGAGTIGNSNFTSCLIFPTDAVTVTYSVAGNAITLSGADNVTIDGRLNAVANIGNTNSLSLNCTVNTNRAIQTQNGSQNVMIRNVNITVPTMTTALTGGRCVNIGQSTSAAQGGQDNNTVMYCNVSGGERTLQTFGSAGFALNMNTVIYGNKVRNSASLAIFIGSDVANVTVDSNEIYDDVAGYKGGAAGTSYRAIGMQATGTVLVQRNIIRDINDNGTRPAGLSMQGIITIPFNSAAPLVSPATTVTLQNNFINMAQNNIKNTTMYGLFIVSLAPGTGKDYTSKVYNNTVLFGGIGTLVEATYALYFDVSDAGAGTSSATYYNNVALNVRQSAATSQHVGMGLGVEPATTVVSDYNTAFANGPITSAYFDFTDEVALFGFNNSFAWKTQMCPLAIEQNSANHPVNYTAGYAIDPVANYGDLNAKVLAGVPTDIFGATKAGTYPYRGAVEGAALKVLTVTAGLEGRTGAENSDMIVQLYNGCTAVDYASAYITDANSSPVYLFAGAVSNGTAYTLQCLTATHLESWSAGTATFTAGTAAYTFSSAASIFGGNGTATGEFFAGDVNQDGTIDAADLALIDNDVINGLFGCRLATDINYDGTVDGSDLNNCDNNVAIGQNVAAPCAPDNIVSEVSKLRNTEKVKLSTDTKSNMKKDLGF